MNVLRNEFAKLRHLHLVATAASMTAGIVALTVVGTMTGDAAGHASAQSLAALSLAGLSLAFPLVSPLMIAVVASRTIDIEHHGNGWLLSRATGVALGELLRAKVISTGLVVTTATVVAVSLGALLGGTNPLWTWLGYAGAMVVVNLVVLALHLVISTLVVNQLISLGIGVLGTVVAICASGFPSWLAHLTPWGYYALASAADYRGDHVMTLSPSYISVAGLAVVGVALFLLVTARLDRQEVLA
ncbi:ABC transporter permease [Rhodococcoides fascians]|uniref:ABC transporter permease n=1 Tax=Rhodococcoides fascians TaxID=1828 RepID=UPI00056CCF68|nr:MULTISPECIES: ABC transporter permease [Rhodococcus]OZF01682.1 ABC transporter permease [Rhodococcus sp. 15-1189-1-1a]OZF15877.1 ABC transporter permease [Rhodococcus sp. 14-2686-1-2]